jgi:hypothetical protein
VLGGLVEHLEVVQIQILLQLCLDDRSHVHTRPIIPVR